VTTRLRDAGIRVVLLDIEGTTTPIAFVHDVLFPFARARVRDWFASRPASDPEAAAIIEELQREYAADVAAGKSPPRDPGAWTLETIVERVHALIDQDRKSTPLKRLQGHIWEQGYAAGSLESRVYPDVPPALARWRQSGIGIGIFSSGSVLAQKLLFAHSDAGDLTPFFRWYFDTSVGAKVESGSYRRIAEAVEAGPHEILFVSDVARELDAARDAGIETRLCVRPPAVRPPDDRHVVITSFEQIAD
jgi:enolase-phosphatase E1